MDISKKLGPFPGMTYFGRQAFDAIVIEASTDALNKMRKNAARRSDHLADAAVVRSGRSGFDAVWKTCRKEYGQTALLYLISTLLTGAFACALALRSADFMGLRDFFGDNHQGSNALLIFVNFAGSVISAILLWAQVARGYSQCAEYPFAATARKTWGLGERAVYISDTKENQMLLTTVFYDAIGSVDIDQNDEGLDIVTLRSRDGSIISDFVNPVTSETENAKVIADAITERAASARKGLKAA